MSQGMLPWTKAPRDGGRGASAGEDGADRGQRGSGRERGKCCKTSRQAKDRITTIQRYPKKDRRKQNEREIDTWVVAGAPKARESEEQKLNQRQKHTRREGDAVGALIEIKTGRHSEEINRRGRHPRTRESECQAE
jgi:hypothetical protein